MSELDDLYIRIGKNLSYLREAKHLTQTQLANESLISSSQSVISDYEHAKRPISLATMERFCRFFNVNLEDLMFSVLLHEKTNSELVDTIIDKNAPIYKCSNKTYYCYYIEEHGGSNGNFLRRIVPMEIKIAAPRSSYEAGAKIIFSIHNDKTVMDAILHMDESYAYLVCQDLRRDFNLQLNFYYFRKSLSSAYTGGIGLLQTLDRHSLPVCQFCIISANAVSQNKFPSLIKQLSFDIKEDSATRLSHRTISSSAVLRLTKKKNTDARDWLRKNVGLP